MCAGAIGWSQASELVYGAPDEKKGYSLVQGQLLHPKTKITTGILKDECGGMLVSFFRSKRNNTR
jgi:tRNA(adenine34) deaminase